MGGPSPKCIHSRRRYDCVECGGAGICSHKMRKSRCAECGGKELCSHGNKKGDCVDCGGSQICEHDKRRRRCVECNGAAICEHNKNRQNCVQCKGSLICVHDKKKSRCKICDGSELCKSPLCETRGIKKYNGYCLPCCIHLCPDIDVSRNFKTKETNVVDRVKKEFPGFSWVCDKKVVDGCSKRRPDLLLDMGSHIIIIEVDENKHDTYDCSCENKRLMEISQDVGHRPIVFIRFNPDNYVDKDGKKISSCWKVNGYGVMQVSKTKIVEWEERIKALLAQIQYWVDNNTEKTVEIIELFY
ncbi:hypothetical protein OAS95_04655 [Pelagibacteraceae bacterium]|nr:hypothetical protein [Pelagibacteraceae bacterium]